MNYGKATPLQLRLAIVDQLYGNAASCPYVVGHAGEEPLDPCKFDFITACLIPGQLQLQGQKAV